LSRLLLYSLIFVFLQPIGLFISFFFPTQSLYCSPPKSGKRSSPIQGSFYSCVIFLFLNTFLFFLLYAKNAFSLLAFLLTPILCLLTCFHFTTCTFLSPGFFCPRVLSFSRFPRTSWPKRAKNPPPRCVGFFPDFCSSSDFFTSSGFQVLFFFPPPGLSFQMFLGLLPLQLWSKFAASEDLSTPVLVVPLFFFF